MKRFFIIIGIACWVMTSSCRPTTNPATEQAGASSFSAEEIIQQYEAKGLVVLNRLTCELTLDSLEDLILVLNVPGEDTLSNLQHPLKRKFVLAEAIDSDHFMVRTENENLVYHYGYDENFPEPLVDITCTEGTFTINHYGGFATRWGRATSFTYDAKKMNWFFEKDEFTTFPASDSDTIFTEVIQLRKQVGDISVQNFDLYDLKERNQ